MSSHTPRLPRTFRFLPWDSDFFGFPIAAVRPPASRRSRRVSAFSADLSTADRAGIRCLYLEDAAGSRPVRRFIERLGFHLVDERMNYVTAIRKVETEPSLRVRRARQSDLPALRAITAKNFTESRFFIDRRFPRQKVQQLFEVWVRNAYRKTFAAELFVAFANEKPIGFVALQVAGRTARISLIGVHPQAKGRGAGRALVERALAEARQRGAARLRVRTQRRNSSACRFYERLGFRLEGVTNVYHRWRAP